MTVREPVPMVRDLLTDTVFEVASDVLPVTVLDVVTECDSVTDCEAERPSVSDSDGECECVSGDVYDCVAVRS